MSTLNTVQFKPQAGFDRGESLGESEAKNEENQIDQAKATEERVANNSVWTNFLTNSEKVSFTRVDSLSESQESRVKSQGISFESIYADISDKWQESRVKEDIVQEVGENLSGSITFEQRAEVEVSEAVPSFVEVRNDVDPRLPVTHEAPRKMGDGIKEKTGEIIGAVGKDVKKAVGDVFGAAKELFGGIFGGFFSGEKKKDPNAEKNAKKDAERRANKAQFIALLREGMSIYYAEMRKMIYMLEAKLGVNSLRAEDKNQLLGRNRNASFEGNDNIYAIHQTAFAMAEQRKRQQQAASAPAAARGKPSRGQMFLDKNLSGERSAGNNMMSAVG